MNWGETMTNSVQAVGTYSFKSDDQLLLDTNIWMLVYGPQRPGDRRVAAYSQALADMLAANSRIYIDVLIVSEFINTYARLKWNVVGKPQGDFKQFRKSADFKPIAKEIAADLKRVLKHCTRIENDFAVLDIDGLVNEYAAGDTDFNDQVLAELCRKRGLTLVTDDGDFGGQGVSVVTANRRLLA